MQFIVHLLNNIYIQIHIGYQSIHLLNITDAEIFIYNYLFVAHGKITEPQTNKEIDSSKCYLSYHVSFHQNFRKDKTTNAVTIITFNKLFS